jgi:sigma-B regulation protein RsbU (phosphoserine phosphatase)
MAPVHFFDRFLTFINQELTEKIYILDEIQCGRCPMKKAQNAEGEFQKVQTILGEYKPPATYGSVIASIASNFHFIHENAAVAEVSKALKGQDSIYALGVVDDSGRAWGVVIKSEMKEQLSKPYGNEILGKRPIKVLAKNARSFPWQKNILTVATKIDNEVHQQGNSYFLLHDENQEFAGLFTTKDMLIYLYNNTKNDISLASRIQSAIVPEKLESHLEDIEVLGMGTMAKGVGGDFCVSKMTGPGRYIFAVCDVSGKGIAASLVTTIIGGMFEAYDFKRGLKGFIQTLNDYVLKTFNMEKYLTGVFGEIDLHSGTLSYYDMGHSYLSIFRPGSIFKPQPSNPFLGFMNTIEPKGKKVKLEENDLIIAFTDGIPEQSNGIGEEYGLQKFDDIVNLHLNDPLHRIKDAILEDHKNFRGDQPKGDDLTLLMFRLLHIPYSHPLKY